MKFGFLFFLLFSCQLSFSQGDSSISYFQSSNEDYIVQITNEKVYLYQVYIQPYGIQINEELVLGNILHDSSSFPQLELFYSNGHFNVEKSGLEYHLTKLNKKGKPKKTWLLDLYSNPLEMQVAINSFHANNYISDSLYKMEKDFGYYDPSWGIDNVENIPNQTSKLLAPTEYLIAMKQANQLIFDSIRALNQSYTEFLFKLKTQHVSLEETKEMYFGIDSLGFDFQFYRIGLIREISLNKPEYYFAIAGYMSSKKEREYYYREIEGSEKRKMKAIDADADLKREFRKVHRKKTILKIGATTLEASILILGLFFLIL